MLHLTKFLQGFVPQEDVASGLAVLVVLIAIGVAAFIANFIAKKIIVAGISHLLKKTQTQRDDIFLQRGVFEKLSHLAPALIVYACAPLLSESHPAVASFVLSASLIYLVIAAVLFLDALINAGVEVYGTYRISKDFPIKSFAQVAKLLIYFFGVIAILSLILGKSPVTFLAGFGALTAVLMFVFKDPILGFVAGIQLSANRMVAVGDWIEMPKYGVDGDVMEIALTTVKIRNFDKTITTVPTQSLISDSFKNWRGMSETGGRRIKRSIFIDVSSIKFCDEEMLDRFAKIEFVAEYLQTKKAELEAYNEASGIDISSAVNGRKLTNIGTFRAYIEAYLRNHSKISKSLTLLVRQLQPTENGIPIEIYTFSLETDWLVYEGLQADIFDHIFAAVSEFDLKIFQNPTYESFGKLQMHQ